MSLKFSQSLALRSLNTTAIRNAENSKTKLKRLQEHFQKDDGKPVYLKGSYLDKVLYGITVGLCVVGMGCAFEYAYKAAMPPKN